MGDENTIHQPVPLVKGDACSSNKDGLPQNWLTFYTHVAIGFYVAIAFHIILWTRTKKRIYTTYLAKKWYSYQKV